MSKTRTKKSEARQQIVGTAERQFYAEDLRAVEINRIVAEAELAIIFAVMEHSPKCADVVKAAALAQAGEAKK